MSKPLSKGGTSRAPAKRASAKKSAKVAGRPAPRGADDASPSSTARSPSTVLEAAEPVARSPKNILTAGIKALTSAHEEVVARQSRVFESLLGLGPRRDADANEPTPASNAATALDPFGFKKFEDVFDQRVARATQHLGLPTAEAFADLTAEVERLRAAVERLEAQAKTR